MLSKVRVKIFAKFNLTLNVVGKKDGLHLLDSVVASVNVCDTITVRDRLDDKINLTVHSALPIEDNIVLKAIRVLRKSFGPFGADIVVEKNIPIAGGMGGSSADAAGVIAALNLIFDFNMRGLDLSAACKEIGSDVFYMMTGGYARMEGTGDIITPISASRDYGAVFITSDGTSAKEVYSRFDELKVCSKADNDEVIRCLKTGKIPALNNMLLQAAASMDPVIERNLRAMNELGLGASLTGSGSTVFALCDEPESAAAKLKEKGFDARVAYTQKSGICFV